MNVKLGGDAAELMLVWTIVIAVLWAIVHISFAIAIVVDSERLVKSGAGTVFVGRFTWTVATLLGGVFVALAYWAMHHSRFRRIASDAGIPAPYSPNPMAQAPLSSQRGYGPGGETRRREGEGGQRPAGSPPANGSDAPTPDGGKGREE